MITPHDNVNITMRMSDGSLGIITYVANGDVSIPKERIVMSCGNATAVMENFQALTLARDGKQTKKKGTGDKGHQHEVAAFMDAIRKKSDPVIPLESLMVTTRATFAIIEALTAKQVITLDDRGIRE